jgi:serine/threonine protein phosphatase PrpC
MPHQVKERKMPEWMVESSQLSHVGQKRHHNEDYVGYYEPAEFADLEKHGRLYVLADGVGGAAAGEVASQYTVNKIIHTYYHQQAHQDGSSRLKQVIEEANAAVFARNLDHAGQPEMATTVVAAVIRGDEVIVANVGDSRAYIIQAGRIEQITQDHSLMAEMINDGVITAEQAETHPYRNVILRSIGAYETVQVDLFSRQLAPGDTLILCSDGLTRLVSNSELVDITRKYPPNQATHQLVTLANERGGDDNITVSITHIGNQRAEEGQPLGAGQLPQMPRWEDFPDS